MLIAQAVAALLLAAAVLIGGRREVAPARLAGLRPVVPEPVSPDRGRVAGAMSTGSTGSTRSTGRSARVTTAAVIGIGALTAALGGWPGGLFLGPMSALAAFVGCRRWLGGTPIRLPWLESAPDPFDLAGCWGLLAACLRGGLPVPMAVGLVVPELPAPAREAMRRTAKLLALGADPVQAWQPALDCSATAELARGARRTARSGAALAGIAEALAVEVRDKAGDLAEARAQRAAVAVTGPLGLCFLPAFVCLGVIPVVIGLATRLMSSW
ncbi:MAG TPA: type II secretion system F family protein [Pseudonocardiaceae bacterium]|jgi:hypothetical protein|nr:type II secretion system F family protein [Pseudonocardiaceae bacterium]